MREEAVHRVSVSVVCSAIAGQGSLRAQVWMHEAVIHRIALSRFGHVRAGCDSKRAVCSPVDAIMAACFRCDLERSCHDVPAPIGSVVRKEVMINDVAAAYGWPCEHHVVGAPSLPKCEVGLSNVDPKKDPAASGAFLWDETCAFETFDNHVISQRVGVAIWLSPGGCRRGL